MRLLSVALNSIDLVNNQGWYLLLPAGHVVGRDGRNWINQNPQVVVQAFTTNSADLPVDIEHSTELKAPQGEPSPAVGWIKQLRVSGTGGVEALIEWTDAGKQLVDSKAYRYMSPVFVFNASSKEVVRLTSVGLTNQPNLYLPALNHNQKYQEDDMSIAAIALALGLSADASEKEVLAATHKAMNAVNTPPLDKFVPNTDYKAMEQRALNAEQKLQAINTAQKDAEITSAVEAAIVAGKIAPASKDYHIAACRVEGGLDRFNAFVTSAPSITITAINSQQPTQGSAIALSDVEKAICQQMGISEADFAKSKGVQS